MKETIKIDSKHRVVIQKQWAKNGHGYFILLEEKFLWFWIVMQVINDGWERIYGYSSIEKAREEAERIKTKFLTN